MKNRTLSVISGVLTGWLVVFAGEQLTHRIFPPPTPLHHTDEAALEAYMQNMPVNALIAMLLVWALSAFLGGLVSGRLAGPKWKRICLITGTILLIGNVANYVLIPHPIWVNVLSTLMYLPLAYSGALFSGRKEENT